MSEPVSSAEGTFSGTTNSSDLSAPKPQGADPYIDKAAVNKRIDFFLQRDRFTRWLFEREWFRNVLFYIGKQWVIYSITSRRWRPRSLPNWFPQPVTNKFAEKMNDIISSLVQGRVPITYNPATDDPADIATAEVGEKLREVLYEEAKIDDHEMMLASWVALTGNGFVHTYWDYDPGSGTKFTQHWQCPQCQSVTDPQTLLETKSTCPQCGSEGLIPAKSPDGTPIGTDQPTGRLHADVLSPFEIRVDPTIPDMAGQTRLIRVRTYDLDFAKKYWGNRPGADGLPIDPEKIVADKESSIGQFYLDALSYITGSFGAGGGFISGGGSSFRIPRVTAYEFYELPTDDYPEGLHAVRLGHSEDMVVQAEPLPDRYKAGPLAGQPFLPFTHFGSDVVPGRFWRKTRADDLISPQTFRNLVESCLKLTTQRTGNPLWLNPRGSQTSNITGEPGQNIDYNPLSLGGTTFAKPERVPAELSNVQPFIILMKELDDEMDRVVGTFFLTGGTAPPGVTAASALSYLGERAERSQSPLRREWAKSWKNWEVNALEIARAHLDEDRVRIIAGKNRRWEVQKFMIADLVGGVNLTIDYNGLFRKSNATKRADIELLLQMQVLNPQDPETNWQILQAFGETSLKGSTDLDVTEAIKEADDFIEKGVPPELVPLVQNSMVHIQKHKDFAKTDEFKELPLEMKQFWYTHIQLHMQDLVAQMAALAPPPSASGPPPPGGGAGAKPPADPHHPPAAGGSAGEPGPVKKGQAAAAGEGTASLQPTPLPNA